MRTLLAVLTLAALLPLAVPEADAFGWCTAAGPTGHRCYEHVVCIGWSHDSRGERCNIGFPLGDPCDRLCWVGPPLP